MAELVVGGKKYKSPFSSPKGISIGGVKYKSPFQQPEVLDSTKDKDDEEKYWADLKRWKESKAAVRDLEAKGTPIPEGVEDELNRLEDSLIEGEKKYGAIHPSEKEGGDKYTKLPPASYPKASAREKDSLWTRARRTESARSLLGPEPSFVGEHKPAGSYIDKHGLIGAAFRPTPMVDWIPEIKEEDVKTVFGDSVAANVGLGILNEVNHITKSLGSIGGAATMGGLRVAGKLVEGEKVARAGHRLFATDLTRNVIENYPTVKRTVSDPNASLKEKTEAVTGTALLSLFAAGAIKGSFKEVMEGASTPQEALARYEKYIDREAAAKLDPKRAQIRLLEEPRVDRGPDVEAFKEKIPEALREAKVEPLPEDLPAPELKPVLEVDPLDTMNLKELKAEAAKEGIDIKGIRKKVDIAEKIKGERSKDSELFDLIASNLKGLKAKEFGEKGIELADEKTDVYRRYGEGKGELPSDWQGKLEPPSTEKIIEELRKQKEIEEAIPTDPIVEAIKEEKAVDPVVESLREEKIPAVEEVVKEKIVPDLEATRRVVTEEVPESEPIAERALKAPRDAAELFRTQAVSRYRPAERMQEQIYEAAEREMPEQDIAANLELLAGSYGRAELLTRRFETDVLDKVHDLAAIEPRIKQEGLSVMATPKMREYVEGELGKIRTEFNAYMFLNRTKNRLESGERRKRVEGYDLNRVEAELKQLAKENGPEITAEFERISKEFQKHADVSLKLQLDSGRMSKEIYDLIKSENDFYAPFMLDEFNKNYNLDAVNKGKAAIDSHKEIIKKIEGIADKDFKLKDFSEAMRRQLWESQISSDKNIAMSEFSRLADIDKDGTFINKLEKGDQTKEGWGKITVLEKGSPVDYEVHKAVYDSVKEIGFGDYSPYGSAARYLAQPFKLGATGANIRFQLKNLLMADMPAAALLSKMGIKDPLHTIPWIFEPNGGYLSSLYAGIHRGKGPLSESKIGKALFGDTKKMYETGLEAGVLRSTLQSMLDPQSAMQYKASGTAPRLLDSLGKISNAIEESFKIHGVHQAIKMKGAKNIAELLENNPELVTEVRRYHGSPDFARFGKSMEHMNLLFMFLNARMQGTARATRLLRQDTPEGRKAMKRLMLVVGVPVMLNWVRNQNQFKDAWDNETSEHDKDNNIIVYLPWKIKKKVPSGKAGEDKFVESQDFLAIPKREEVKLIANATEHFLDALKREDPEAVAEFVRKTFEDWSPLNIKADGAGLRLDERLLSVVSQVHPAVRVPVEMGVPRGYESWRGRHLMSSQMQEADPKDRYHPDTPEWARKLGGTWVGEKLGGPIKTEHAVKGMTAGLLTQFEDKKVPEGRPEILYYPPVKFLTGSVLPIKLSSGYVDDKGKRERYKEGKGRAATRQIRQRREALSFIEDKVSKGLNDSEIKDAAADKYYYPHYKGVIGMGTREPYTEEKLADYAVFDRIRSMIRERAKGDKDWMLDAASPKERAEELLYRREAGEKGYRRGKEWEAVLKRQTVDTRLHIEALEK